LAAVWGAHAKPRSATLTSTGQLPAGSPGSKQLRVVMLLVVDVEVTGQAWPPTVTVIAVRSFLGTRNMPSPYTCRHGGARVRAGTRVGGRGRESSPKFAGPLRGWLGSVLVQMGLSACDVLAAPLDLQSRQPSTGQAPTGCVRPSRSVLGALVCTGRRAVAKGQERGIASKCQAPWDVVKTLTAIV
jgi:hypothetical protein